MTKLVQNKSNDFNSIAQILTLAISEDTKLHVQNQLNQVNPDDEKWGLSKFRNLPRSSSLILNLELQSQKFLSVILDKSLDLPILTHFDFVKKIKAIASSLQRLLDINKWLLGWFISKVGLVKIYFRGFDVTTRGMKYE